MSINPISVIVNTPIPNKFPTSNALENLICSFEKIFVDNFIMGIALYTGKISVCIDKS